VFGGVVDGVLDGVLDGELDGVTDGVADGVFDGVLDGVGVADTGSTHVNKTYPLAPTPPLLEVTVVL